MAKGANLKMWEPGNWAYVCGHYFVSRKPNSDINDPDYAPSLNLQPHSFFTGFSMSISSDSENSSDTKQGNEVEEETAQDSVSLAVDRKDEQDSLSLDVDGKDEQDSVSLDVDGKEEHDSVSRDVDGKEELQKQLEMLQLECKFLREERDSFRRKLEKNAISEESITERSSIYVRNQVFLTLIKLRLGVPNNDLAYKFHISCTTVSEVFNECLAGMS